MAYRHEAWFAPGGGAETVPGFLSAESSDFLSRLLSHQLDTGREGSLVEIGTYMGRTFIGMAMASRPHERVVGFDLFPTGVHDGLRKAAENLTPEELKEFHVFMKNTNELSVADYMRHVGKPARFVHIDGGHSHWDVVQDMNLATSFLAPGALVVFDDFMHDWYPDLTEGVLGALRMSPHLAPVAVVPRLKAVTGGGSKLICATRDSSKDYRAFLMEAYADKSPDLRPLVGSSVLTFKGFGLDAAES